MLANKGQISMEYMSIMGFVTLVVIFLLFISQIYSKDVEQQIILNQADRIAKDIISAAESVYYFGNPSKISIEVYMPKQVESINIGNKEIVFKVNTKQGLTDVFRKSSVNITGDISVSAGYHIISIEAKKGGYVRINST